MATLELRFECLEMFPPSNHLSTPLSGHMRAKVVMVDGVIYYGPWSRPFHSMQQKRGFTQKQRTLSLSPSPSLSADRGPVGRRLAEGHIFPETQL